MKPRPGLLAARLLFGLCLALALPALVRATSVLPLGLDRIVHDARVIFQGTVTGVRSERDPETGWIVSYVTFRVDDALKGAVGSTYVVKQIGGRLPDGESYHVDGVPSYVPGRSYVMFLTGPSTVGLSSPIGLSQGKFRIESSANGAEVSNGRDFREMTARIPRGSLPPAVRARIEQKAGGRVPTLALDDFKQLVRQRIAAR